jgi:hypothetical protein
MVPSTCLQTTVKRQGPLWLYMSYVKASYEPSKAFILACNAFRSQLQGQQVQMPPAPAALAGPSSDGPVALAAAATAEELAGAEVGQGARQHLESLIVALPW